ncbi:hypothetical protein SAMN05421813_11451 [Daejeonella rubra]|uniref:Uncharacterized protein n=1 Tax=Daejeonella rubra TaxID=990371 RepID=A0A1G9TWJ3_9SPHI|nr:hypothetical protein SAMN05421813_11451 [Daejeonella rubra]
MKFEMFSVFPDYFSTKPKQKTQLKQAKIFQQDLRDSRNQQEKIRIQKLFILRIFHLDQLNKEYWTNSIFAFFSIGTMDG